LAFSSFQGSSAFLIRSSISLIWRAIASALIFLSFRLPQGLVDYPLTPGVASTGFAVTITHESLNKITANNQQFFQTETFNGGVRFTAKRERMRFVHP
jgi:hypothetical protein